LKYAEELKRNAQNVPLTLCCTEPKYDLMLVASPIPETNPIKPDANSAETPLKINQGELHRFKRENTTVGKWLEALRSIEWKTLLFADDKMDHRIIKISCISVHPVLIPIPECWNALRTLHAIEELVMKDKMANVLLGCA
jgi:hypothetical protein